MSEQGLPLLVGGAIGLLTAIVTSWLNARAFRQELGEDEILKDQLRVYAALWTRVSRSRHRALALHGKMACEEANRGSRSDAELIQRINEYYGAEATPILLSLSDLDGHFLTLPGDVIQAVTDYQDAVVAVLHRHRFDMVGTIETKAEEVLRLSRQELSALVGRKYNPSRVFGLHPSNGYVAAYIQQALKARPAQDE